jgi:hypothetical protein
MGLISNKPRTVAQFCLIAYKSSESMCKYCVPKSNVDLYNVIETIYET